MREGAASFSFSKKVEQNKAFSKKNGLKKKKKKGKKITFAAYAARTLARRLSLSTDDHSAMATPLSFPPHKFKKESPYWFKKKKKKGKKITFAAYAGRTLARRLSLSTDDYSAMATPLSFPSHKFKKESPY